MASYRIGFTMDQVAGHVTNYHNLRSVADRDPEVVADWCKVEYYRRGGSIERVRERLLPFVPTYFSGIARGTVEMRRGLRGGPYDALFTNASVAVFFSRTFRRIPTMFDFDSTPLQLDAMEAYTARPDPRPISAVKFRLFRSLLHSATLLQTWSRWAKQSAVDDYGVSPEKVVINPPGVNLDLWKPDHAGRPPAEGRPVRVLFVGGDFRRKGGEHLLEWYRSQRADQYELHIVTREPVEARPGVFVYHDIQPNSPELLGLYARSDLFVLPSLGECFGIATVEAMAAGLPVIQSDVGGTADIIEPGRNGFIVPAGSAGELGGAIESVAGDASRMREMGVQSREIAEERFDLEKNARKTLSYLKQLAQTRAAARPAASTSLRPGHGEEGRSG